jgi:copper chaperone CopZ
MKGTKKMFNKKNLVGLILPIVILFFVSGTITAKNAFSGENEKTVISIPTVQCESCQSRIEKALKGIDGVIDYKVDLDAKTASVTYDNSKTSVADLEIAITKVGYDANDKKADQSAYDKLPGCCKGK